MRSEELGVRSLLPPVIPSDIPPVILSVAEGSFVGMESKDLAGTKMSNEE